MRIRMIVVGTAAFTLLAGCGNGGGTTGTPTNGTQPTSTSNSSGAPKVSNPLNVSAVEAAPCSGVTAAQLTAFGLPGVAGKVVPSSPGASCIWSGSLTAAAMTPGLAVLPTGTNLESIYANKDTSYTVFEPQPAIQGYPAVVTLQADQRKDGNCTLAVGVSDERAMLFTFLSDEKSTKFADPCAGVTEFANLVITTIKAGAK